MKRRSLFVLLMLSTSSILFAQKAPLKFGDVSIDELRMTAYPLDTSAAAVILFDFGHFRAANATFTRLLRIKILKKEGYDRANVRFQSRFKSAVRGITTNLENGKPVQSKLRSESVFQTRMLDDFYLVSAAMPDVSTGSVIDIEIIFQGVPLVWKFQDEIPVSYSELIMENSNWIEWRTNFSGHQRLTYSTPTHWIARDMPAVKKEPVMNSADAFMTKLKFDILAYNTTWEKVNELLSESDHFGMPSTSSSFLNELAADIGGKGKSREELLVAAFDAIREKLTWNNDCRLSSQDGNLASVFKLGTGSSADINLILYKLLKKLDFETYPVALSTVENGPILIYSPSIQQLNYVIVYARIGEKEYYLDATERYLPYNMLPIRCLNVQGRIIDEHKDTWLNLSTAKKDRDIAIYSLALDENLAVSGSASINRYDYSAFFFRNKYYEFNSSEEYLEDYLKNMPGMLVKECTFLNLDSIYKPVIEKQEFVLNNRISEANGSLYFIPAYFEKVKENPFKMESRQFPVEFNVLCENTVIVNLSIPEGFTVASMPKTETYKLEGNSASFMYDAVNTGTVIKITTKFSINKPTFLPEEYGILREFYNQLIRKQNQPIIIRKGT